MRLAVIICGLITCCLAQPVWAKSKPAAPEIDWEKVDVRPVERNSSDVFAAISVLLGARHALEAGEMHSAYTGFKQIALSDPENIEALLGWGDAALALAYIDDARIAFQRAAGKPLSPDEKLRHFAGQTLVEILGQADTDREKLLLAATKIVPGDTRLWTLMGQYYDDQEQWEQSAHAYRQARMAGQSEAGMTNNFGMSYLAQKRFKAAIELFTLATTLDPDEIQYDNNRRLALLLDGQYLTALNDIEIDRAAPLLNDAGYVAMKRGDRALARLLLEKAMALSPVYYTEAATNLERLNAS